MDKRKEGQSKKRAEEVLILRGRRETGNRKQKRSQTGSKDNKTKDDRGKDTWRRNKKIGKVR